MADPFVPLFSGLPNLKYPASSGSVQYTCSVTKGGDLEDFRHLPDSVARIIVTIGCMDESWAIEEKALQRTLFDVLHAFSQAADGEPDLSFVPFVVALERTPVGACYTILCQYRSEEDLDRYHEITSTMFESLAAERSIIEGLLWVSTTEADSCEFAHLLTRTAGRDEGPFPLFPE
jgi:hypothetical protein